MTKKIVLQLLSVAFVFAFSLDATAQRKKKDSKDDKKAPVVTPAVKPEPKKTGPQPYGKVVTKDMTTDKGLFHVHSKDDTYLFEIPDSLFEREMLMVTRIAKTASEIGFGGGKTATTIPFNRHFYPSCCPGSISK